MQAPTDTGDYGNPHGVVHNPMYESYLQKLQRQRSQRGTSRQAGDEANQVRKSYGDLRPTNPAEKRTQSRVQESPIRSSASQVLRSNSFDRNLSQFFGVTPLQGPKAVADVPAGRKVPKDKTWRIGEYGEDAVESTDRRVPSVDSFVPAGKKVPKDQTWKIGIGYSDDGGNDLVEAPQRLRITEVVKSAEAAVPAGRKVQKDPVWSLGLGYKETAPKGSPVKAMQTAGYKVQKDEPWKLAEGYTLQEEDRKKRKMQEEVMDIPAGKQVPKDPVWNLGEGKSIDAYRRNSEYVAFSPELRKKKGESVYEQTAGRKIPRDQPFVLAYDPSPVKSSRSGVASYRSITPQPALTSLRS